APGAPEMMREAARRQPWGSCQPSPPLDDFIQPTQKRLVKKREGAVQGHLSIHGEIVFVVGVESKDVLDERATPRPGAERAESVKTVRAEQVGARLVVIVQAEKAEHQVIAGIMWIGGQGRACI